MRCTVHAVSRCAHVLASLLVPLVGCGPDAALTIPPTPLHEFETRRAAAAGEWRDAREVGGAQPVALELGYVSAGDALRFGFFDPAKDNGGTIRAYVGDRRVETVHLDGRGLWRDKRIEFDNPEPAPLRLVVNAQQPLHLAPCEVIRPAEADTRPNVLVLLIDTLRQDHMSVYGYDRDTTPVMRRFAQDATLLTQLTPSSSWTRPSVATLFTSMQPNYHGAQTNRDKLREGLPSLARSLATAGYATEGLMSNANCVPEWGFGDDFARYLYVDFYMEESWEDDPVATDLAIASIQRLRGRPWYLYVHFMSPHKTYQPPEPFRSQFHEDLSHIDLMERRRPHEINLYDAEIAHSDYHFGRILDALQATHQYDDTLIVVLSDHGEEFQEHGGWEHGRTLYEEVLRVPLIIKPPGKAWHVPNRVDALVEMVDIAPTILDVVGVPAPERFQGTSFLPALRGQAIAPRTGFATLDLGWFSLRAARTPHRKYIRDVANESEHWFDLRTDPGELKPLPEPGAWGERLAQRVTDELVGGATGLHLLLTADGDPQDAVVTLECPGCGEPTVNTEEWRNDLHRSEDTIAWTFRSGQANPIPPSEQPTQAAKRVHGHLNIDAPSDTAIRLDIKLSGETVDPAIVHAGSERRNLALDSAVLLPTDLIAEPDAYGIATVPTGLGVYLWYVPPPDVLTDEEFPEELRKKLEALGYVP